eukprot:10106652-Prorocentrum_lima.AAC.1
MEQHLAALEQALTQQQQQLSAQLQLQLLAGQGAQAPAPAAAVSAKVIGKPDRFDGVPGSWRD